LEGTERRPTTRPPSHRLYSHNIYSQHHHQQHKTTNLQHVKITSPAVSVASVSIITHRTLHQNKKNHIMIVTAERFIKRKASQKLSSDYFTLIDLILTNGVLDTIQIMDVSVCIINNTITICV
jgi:hypothetical protein